MTRARPAMSAALALAGVLLHSQTRAEPSRNIADYVILAGEELLAKRLVVEAGDVGVSAGFLQSKKGVQAPSSHVVADLVRLGDKSRCLELSGNEVIQTGSACALGQGFQAPLFPSLGEACGFPASPPPCDPGRPVLVAHRETKVLPPGVYGDVVVPGGSPGPGSLVLEGGEYVFCSLRVGVRTTFRMRGPSSVYVTGRAALSVSSVTGPAPGSNVDPSDIQIFVAGDKARLGQRAQLTGLLCAPDALLRLLNGSRLLGRAVGRIVRVGRVTVRGVDGGGPTTTSTTSTTTSSTTTTVPPSTTSTVSTSTTSSSAPLPSTTSTSSPETTTTSTSSTTTSVEGSSTSTTSTSSTTSTTGASVSTTSTSTPQVSTTSTSTSSTSSTTAPAVCGNSSVETPETCDDGNTTDCSAPGTCNPGSDPCPADCIIDACANPSDPMGPRRNLDISISAAQNLGTVRIYLEYPEGAVIIPGSADSAEVTGSLTMTPAGANCVPNDLDYGFLQACLSFGGFAPGQFTRVGFVTCGDAVPNAGDFQCRVIEATDAIGGNVSATCSVNLLP